MHFRESQHHVDDERVAEEADDTHDGVKDLVDQRNDRQIGLAVLDRRVLMILRVIDTRPVYHARYRACYRRVHLVLCILFIKFLEKEKKFLQEISGISISSSFPRRGDFSLVRGSEICL